MAEALAPFAGVLGSILETLKVSKMKLDTMSLCVLLHFQYVENSSS